MKRSVFILALFVLAGCISLSAQEAKKEIMPPPKPTSPAFDRIKALAGEWEGKSSEGTAVHTIYKVVSNGSAVMNVLDPGGQYEMVTMFHMDGQNIMVTHYCAVGNQPRMVSTPGANPSAIEFAFKDVTNVTKPDEGHMSGLVLTTVDPDHHRQEWIFRESPTNETRDVFEFTRKK